ncbi:MAG: hypothetical protein F6K09_07330 [Merismopedia sp. SIO2A8]|nr:hypothetical protein [Merismopedia sp. SIO2A8]
MTEAFPLVSDPLGDPFIDVAGYWGRSAIQSLVQRQLVTGYPDGTFRPSASLSRAEFAALLYNVFTTSQELAPSLTPPLAPSENSGSHFDQPFEDVPPQHWAYTVIQWSVRYGFFAGYGNQTFRPSQPLSRSQALTVLSSGLKLGRSPFTPQILTLFFDDAADIPDYFEGAIATATLNRLVVNYPNVRQLRPNASITRGEVATLLAQVLHIPEVVPTQYIAWALRLETLTGEQTVALDQLRHHPGLIHQLQTQLAELGLYPSPQIDGRYGPKTEGAIAQFADSRQLSTMATRQLDETFAYALLTTQPADLKLVQALDRDNIFQHFFAQEHGFNSEKLAFLDRGIRQSPYRNEIVAFPDRLKERPDGDDVISSPLKSSWTLQPYPNRGTQPRIDEAGLSFLHSDIQQACVCLGRQVNGQMQTHWMGRQALKPIELWSTTKLVPILNLVAQSNTKFPSIDIDHCQIRQRGNVGGYPVHDLAQDIMSYGMSIGTSNAIAAMMKLFTTPVELEQWLKSITGNMALEFRGRYGEPPFLSQPQLWHLSTGQVLLDSQPIPKWSDNTIATYDLTRLVSMVGWHLHLPHAAKLPGIQWNSLESVVRAMGNDSARYADVAIAQLGLPSVVRSPVIISKLGYGRSSIRDRAELAYTALIQLVDKRPNATGNPAILHTMAMTLIAAKDYGNFEQESLELDARMATEVTELIRRLVQNDWI